MKNTFGHFDDVNREYVNVSAVVAVTRSVKSAVACGQNACFCTNPEMYLFDSTAYRFQSAVFCIFLFLQLSEECAVAATEVENAVAVIDKRGYYFQIASAIYIKYAEITHLFPPDGDRENL